jgi:hypothetical protein
MVRLAKGVFSKALIPMLVTLLGMLTLIIEEFLNQFAPTVTIPLANIIFVGQFRNASAPILVTPVPMVVVAKLVHP